MRLGYILLVVFARSFRVSSHEASPCPRLFVYEKNSLEPNRWYGILTILSDAELHGVWLRVMFDRPILQLGNWFGEAVNRKDNKDYLIKNPEFLLKSHTPKVVRFFVKYNPNYPAPKLVGFRLNARTVCPEDFVTTTPSTTTEQLFTSLDESGNSDAHEEEYTSEASASEAPSGVFVATSDAYETSPASLEAPSSTEQPEETIVTNATVEEICGTVVESRRKTRHIGQITRKGEFPWHVDLYYIKDTTIAYLCGASLISRSHVITVAHCVTKSKTRSVVNAERLVVYCGKYQVKLLQHKATQTHYVDLILSHPEYDPETYNNDIAIVKLQQKVVFTNFVRPVCLWQESSDFASIENRTGTVVGWGFDEQGKIEERLMRVCMVARSPDICNTSFPNYSERFSSIKTYCANFLDDGVECVGDSGGGMAFPKASNDLAGSVWQLRGLVTVSIVLQRQLKCDRSRYVIFTDVAKYLDWVDEAMKREH